MKILVKYLFKSISEKKGRMFLILISISISTAFLVTSIGAVQSVLTSVISQYKDTYESYRVLITTKSKAKEPFFSSKHVDKAQIKKSFIGVEANGYFSKKDNKNFNLIGTTYSSFKGFKSIKILSGRKQEGFSKNKAIISKFASEKLKVKAGDKITLNIMGKNQSYKIAAVVSNNGLFLSDIGSGNTFTLITSEKNVSAIYGEGNKINYMLASVNGNVNKWAKHFNKANKAKNLTAKLLIDNKELSAGTNDIKTILLFMLGVVLIMSMFIIYGSFKLIVVERIPVIGTFLSQGAQFSNIIKMFLAESLAYGALGGVIGDFIGAVLIDIITRLNNPLAAYGVKTDFTVNPKYFVTGFVFAVVLSLLSSVLPIIAIVKMPVKNVILNAISTETRISWKSFIAGTVFIGISVVLHLAGPYTKNPRPFITALPALGLGFIGIILIITKFIDITLYPLMRGLRRINGISMLSLNNVRTSKLLSNNIRLIAVSIMSIVIIMSIKVSIGDLLTGCYKNLNYDISIAVSNKNLTNLKNVSNIIEKYDNTKSIYKRQRLSAYLNGNSSKEIDITCINPEKYKAFDNYIVFKNKSKQLNKLKKHDNGIIISKKISLRYKIKPGSIIKLTSEDKSKKFKVLSVCDAKFENMGNRNFISLKAALKYFDVKYVDLYNLTTKANPKEAKKYFSNRLRGFSATVTTKHEDVENDNRNINGILNILGIFSYVTMVIGAFAIVSNISISYLQRKREMAVLSSIGLTNKGRMILIIIESMIEGLVGAFVSLIASLWVIVLLDDLFKYLVLNADFKYPSNSIGAIIGATLTLMIVTTIPVINKNKKFNLIRELKYE